jgi:hypothetical protein
MNSLVRIVVGRRPQGQRTIAELPANGTREASRRCLPLFRPRKQAAEGAAAGPADRRPGRPGREPAAGVGEAGAGRDKNEEYDVHQRQPPGNLPQAFVHAGMLECTVTLSRDVRLGSGE